MLFPGAHADREPAPGGPSRQWAGAKKHRPLVVDFQPCRRDEHHSGFPNPPEFSDIGADDGLTRKEPRRRLCVGAQRVLKWTGGLRGATSAVRMPTPETRLSSGAPRHVGEMWSALRPARPASRERARDGPVEARPPAANAPSPPARCAGTSRGCISKGNPTTLYGLPQYSRAP
jgi:hypothetical protein